MNKNPGYKWDARFLELAKLVASWSKDPSTKVGAVLVNDDKVVVGMGYNGFPRGVDDSYERYANRELKYKLVAHAEVNAILNAGHRSRGSTLYVWPAFGNPCICENCAKAAIQAGVRRIVGYEVRPEDAGRAARWGDSLAMANLLCGEAGLDFELIPENG